MAIKNPPAKAFTLLEVLLALALTGVIVGVSGHLAIQALEVRRSVNQRVELEAREAYLEDRLTEDLQRATGPVSLDLDPNQRPTIEIPCLCAAPGDSLHTALLPCDVHYRLMREGADPDALTLQRVAVDSTGTSPAAQVTTIAEDLLTFKLELHVENTWWPLESRYLAQARKAQAFRLHCQIQDGRGLTRTYLLSPQEP